MRFGHVSYASMSPFARDLHVSLQSCSVAALTHDISWVGSVTIGGLPPRRLPLRRLAQLGRPDVVRIPLKLGCGCNPRLLREELGADIRLEGIFKVGPDSEVPDDGIAARHFTKYTCSTAVNAELLALDI